MIAHEDVGGESAIGNDAAYGRHAVEIPFTRVFAVHEFENTVGTALHGQMDVTAHVWLFGDNM